MKRLIIICEGPTEQEFCNNVLLDHFQENGVSIEAPTVKKSGGGIVKWESLKKQIGNHLKEDRTAYVTTLIDFYGIQDKGFPKYNDPAQTNAIKVENIEAGMKNDIHDDLRYRFIPYIQLHEFECLVYCSLDVLRSNFKEEEADFKAIENIINTFNSPEDINNSPLTAPSKRLLRHIPGYDKVVDGKRLTSEIGLLKLREKCPRFNNWITTLEKV